MSFISSTWSELVERRLWPVAVGLLVALVAVPLLLSKPAEEPAPPSQPSPSSALLGANSAKLLGETQPAVSVSSDSGVRKHVERLSRKNPFVQQGGGSSSSGNATAQLPTTSTTTTTGGGTPTSGTTTPTTTTPPPTSTTPRLYRYVAKVKFGKIGSTKEKSVDPGEFLPSKTNPVLLYIAATDDGSKALFVVTSGATARGDADCSPGDSNCQLLTMKNGNVEFIEVSVSQDEVVTYELELVDIVLKEVKNPPKLQSNPVTFTPSSHAVQKVRGQMRQSTRTKRVFNALGKLGF
jgi:hypothetical protein